LPGGIMNGAGRHLPNPAPIDAYGNGGFRFAGMSHRGSLMCLPNGIWASDIKSAGEIDEAALAPVLEPATTEDAIDHFLIGTGKDFLVMPTPLREAFRARRIVLESMSTGAAVRTYNILLGERRRIGALLVAVA
jgi:uncharacterized protein